jgi:predicted Zn-dependent protease
MIRRLWQRWAAMLVCALFAVAALAYAGLGSWHRRARSPDNHESDPWQQALRAIETGDLPLAQTCLNRCATNWPLNAEVHFLLGRTCRRMGATVGWQTHLHKAKLLGWPEEQIKFERQLQQAQSGDIWKVEDKLTEYLNAFHPEEGLIFEALAKGYLELYSLFDLERLTDLWLERYPNDWRPRLYRGRTFHIAHTPDRAISEYRRVLDIKPDQADAQLWLAGALTLDGQFEEALTRFQTYLQSHPNAPAAMLGIANCQFSLGQTDAARATLDRLLAESKDNVAGMLVRAKLELEDGTPEEALVWLKRAEAVAPRESDVLQNLARAYRRLGKHRDAETCERQLQDIQKLYERLAIIERQIAKDPENIPLRYEAGVIYLRLGRTEDAARWLRILLRLDPNHQPTHKLLAEHFQQVGDVRRAEYHRRKAQTTVGAVVHEK